MAANLSRQEQAATTVEQPTWSSAAFFGLIVLATVLSIPWLESRNPMLWAVRGAGHRTEDDLETVAQRLNERNGTNRIFSRFEWGEYLSWSLSPRYKIFMDARIEIYPDDVWGQYSAVTRGRADWNEILDRYQVDCLLLDTRYHAELLPVVEKSPVWERTFEAGDAVLFLRRDQRPGEVVRR